MMQSFESEFERAAAAFDAGQIAESERICRALLLRDPMDVDSICLLAEIAAKYGRLEDAAALLNRTIELAPVFPLARWRLAKVLHQRLNLEGALEQLEVLEKLDTQGLWRSSSLVLRGTIMTRLGRNAEAITTYEKALAALPGDIEVLKSLGHARKTIGDIPGAVSAYRSVIAAKPEHGDAWWSLANLKTVHFSPADISQMRDEALSDGISREDFFHISFALGKALEDAGDYEEAFVWYQRGNAVRRRQVRYSAERNRADSQALIAFFTAERVASLAGGGARDASPIFIVGLPRAGSTLVEQILSSHSMVEGTQELPDLMSIAIRLSGRKAWDDRSRYPAVLADMPPDALRALGEEYIERTRIHRSGKPHFIDKLPNNFAHVGLLHAILPNATVVDARRNPMDCCFSGYKQLFAKGQNFSYSLKEIGAYYRDYLDVMEHWDRVLPGKVVRVLNEALIADPDQEIRRLLERCGLPFEDACLAFHQNDRPVRTPSAEQVRRPVNADGFGRWRAFATHLAPLKEALGDSLQRWDAR